MLPDGTDRGANGRWRIFVALAEERVHLFCSFDTLAEGLKYLARLSLQLITVREDSWPQRTESPEI
jgi:hypothetical protein